MTDKPEETTAEAVPDEDADTAAPEAEPDAGSGAESAGRGRRPYWSRMVAFGVLPAVAIVLATLAGYLLWRGAAQSEIDRARAESVDAARAIAIEMLSYQPDTVEQQLAAARERLTGDFHETYGSMVDTVVIPGARDKRISAVTEVPAAASVSAEPDHAVVLLFVNQTVTVGADPPSGTASSVRVTLDKIDDQWKISRFEPI